MRIRLTGGVSAYAHGLLEHCGEVATPTTKVEDIHPSPLLLKFTFCSLRVPSTFPTGSRRDGDGFEGPHHAHPASMGGPSKGVDHRISVWRDDAEQGWSARLRLAIQDHVGWLRRTAAARVMNEKA
eukprot:5332848-Prorocentrum_lima.AAC.1